MSGGVIRLDSVVKRFGDKVVVRASGWGVLACAGRRPRSSWSWYACSPWRRNARCTPFARRGRHRSLARDHVRPPTFDCRVELDKDENGQWVESFTADEEEQWWVSQTTAR